MEAVRARSEHARRCGALVSIPSESEEIEAGGIRFRLRIAESLERKLAAAAKRSPAKARTANPFLPYDENLFVAEVTPTHVCLLNKYCVVDQHLLVVTRHFEEQESLLGLRDFEALWACLVEFESLAFYNAGRQAGASQRHKHLQLVPVPLGTGPERAPIERPILAAPLEGRGGPVPGLPFLHRAARLDGDAEASIGAAAARAHQRYLALLRALGRDGARTPYNLLVTREWMLVVPRVRESWEGIEVNALGFAGALLVRNAAQLERVREVGPMHLLRAVAAPPE